MDHELNPSRTEIGSGQLISLAMVAIRVLAGMCPNKTIVAPLVSRNFTKTHQYRNKPYGVPSDSISPTSSVARLNGTITNQPITSSKRLGGMHRLSIAAGQTDDDDSKVDENCPEPADR